MDGLIRRVDALEAKVPRLSSLVLMRTIVRPGCLGAPLLRADTAAGTLLRRNDEAEPDFMARVKALALAHAKPGATVVCVTAYSTTNDDDEATCARP